MLIINESNYVEWPFKTLHVLEPQTLPTKLTEEARCLGWPTWLAINKRARSTVKPKNVSLTSPDGRVMLLRYFQDFPTRFISL